MPSKYQDQLDEYEAALNEMSDEEEGAHDQKQDNFNKFIDPSDQELFKNIGNIGIDIEGVNEEEPYIQQKKPQQHASAKPQKNQTQQKPQKNYESDMNKYDDMLEGMDDDDDDGNKMEEEKIVVQPQKKQPVQQRPQQQQEGVQQQQKKAQPRAGGGGGNQGQQIQNMINNDQEYFNPQNIQSFLLINEEMTYLSQGIQKRLSPNLTKYLSEKKIQVQQTKEKLYTFYMQKQLTPQKYSQLVQKCFSEHQKLFQLASDKMSKTRLAQKLKLLQDEMNYMKKDPNFLQTTINKFCADLKNMKISSNVKGSIDEEIKFQSERNSNQKQPKFTSDIATRPLSEFKNTSIVFEDPNFSTPEKQVDFLNRRRRQYWNLANYFNSQMQQQKQDEINNFFIPLIQKAKLITAEIEKGEIVQISEFVHKEFKEITPELIHKDTIENHKAKIKNLATKITDLSKFEKNYQKMASKNLKTKQNAEESAKRVEIYQQYMEYMAELLKNLWIPFPVIQTTEQSRPLFLENKQIEHNIMRIIFQRFTNCSSKKLKVNFSINLNGQVIQQETKFCDKLILNQNFDIKTGQDKRSACKNLNELFIQLIVFEDGFFSSSEVGQAQISLEELETSNQLEGSVDIKSNGQTKMKLEYGVYIREPVAKFSKKSLEVVDIVKKYPAIDINVGVDTFVEQNKLKKPQQQQPQVQVQSQQPQQQQQAQAQSQAQSQIQQSQMHQSQQQQQEQQQQQQINPNEPKIFLLRHGKNDPSQKVIDQITEDQLPQGVTLADVKLPEDPAKYICNTILEKMIPILEQGKSTYKQNGEREEARIAEQLYMDYRRQLMMIQSKVNNGTFTIQQYVQMVVDSIERDTKLVDFYKKLGLNQWVQFMNTRIFFFKQEKAEFDAQSA